MHLDAMIIENGVNGHGQSVKTSNMISRVSAPVSEVRRSVNSDLDSCGSSEVINIFFKIPLQILFATADRLMLR